MSRVVTHKGREMVIYREEEVGVVKLWSYPDWDTMKAGERHYIDDAACSVHRKFRFKHGLGVVKRKSAKTEMSGRKFKLGWDSGRSMYFVECVSTFVTPILLGARK